MSLTGALGSALRGIGNKAKIEGARRSVLVRLGRRSELDYLIAPEVSGDELARTLTVLAMLPSVKLIIEVGSSDGRGSTSALIAGIRRRADQHEVSLFCFELSRIRFEKLRELLNEEKYATAINLPSVNSERMATPEVVKSAHSDPSLRLSGFRLAEVMRWRKQDLDYLQESGRDFDGIQVVRDRYKLPIADLALIDGSEFTGQADAQALKGSKVFVLDDTETLKGSSARREILSWGGYEEVMHRPSLRNGFAVLVRSELAADVGARLRLRDG